MSAALSLTPEQLEAIIARAADAGAMRALALMQGELRKRVTKPAAPSIIDASTQAAANEALERRGISRKERRR